MLDNLIKTFRIRSWRVRTLILFLSIALFFSIAAATVISLFARTYFRNACLTSGIHAASVFMNFSQGLWLRTGLLLCGIAITSALAFIYAYLNISKRFTNIIDALRNGSDIYAEESRRSKDGVEAISNTVFRIIEENQELTRSIYHEQLMRKEAQLMVLQAQINPHFLYNILDTMNWMAMTKQAPEISDVAQKLAKFYRLRLSNGNDIVPVSVEIEVVLSYLELQKFRFHNQVNVVLDVEERIKQCMICCMVLQPLVENSLLHGILEQDDDHGSIWISGYHEGETAVITVEDDGVGISREIADKINSGVDVANRSGYGLYNTNLRMRLYFGEAYGIRIEPSQRGTIATVRFPMRPYPVSG